MAITPGTYVLLNVANTNLAMDTQGATSTNGANVRLYTRNDSDGQLVTVVKEGSYYALRFPLTGKVVDVKGATVAQGQNVQQYSWNKGKSQLWTFVDAGAKTAIDGSDGRCYYIRTALPNSNNYQIEAYGAASAVKSVTNLDIAKASTANDHKWVFVPKPILMPGVYRFLSVKDQSVCLGLTGMAGDTNVYLQGVNDTNLQRWKVSKTGNNFWLESVEYPKKYMTPRGYAAENSKIVQLGTDSTQTATKWLPVQVGTAKYNGNVTDCYEFRCQNGVNMVLDVQGDKTAIGTNLETYTDNNGKNQMFVVVPETVLDSSVGAPTDPGVASKTGGAKAKSVAGVGKVAFVPTWAGGASKWQLRYRSRRRLVSSADNQFQSWTAWKSIDGGSSANSGWGVDSVPNCLATKANDRNYAKALNYTVNTTDQDLYEVQYQVRQWVSGSKHGPTATFTGRVKFRPTCTISTAKWSPKGLTISYSANQKRKNNDIVIYEVKSGSRTVFSSDTGRVFTDKSYSGSIVIPQSVLTYVPATSGNVKVTFRYTNVDGAYLHSKETQTVPFSRDSGSITVHSRNVVAPDKSNGWMLHVESDVVGETNKLLIDYGSDGVKLKTYLSEDGKWDVPILYGRSYTYYVMIENGSAFGIASDSMTKVQNPHAYVFNYKRTDGTPDWYVLKLNEGDYPEYTRSFEADFDAQLTNGKSFEVVHFGNAQRGGGTVAGVYVSRLYTDHAGLGAARRAIGQYAWLRPPDDAVDVYRVAITGVEIDQSPRTYSEVQVSFRIINDPEDN